MRRQTTRCWPGWRAFHYMPPPSARRTSLAAWNACAATSPARRSPPSASQSMAGAGSCTATSNRSGTARPMWCWNRWILCTGCTVCRGRRDAQERLSPVWQPSTAGTQEVEQRRSSCRGPQASAESQPISRGVRAELQTPDQNRTAPTSRYRRQRQAHCPHELAVPAHPCAPRHRDILSNGCCASSGCLPSISRLVRIAGANYG